VAESTLAVSLTELRSEVGRFLGHGRDYASIAADPKLTVDACIHRGLRQFYFPPPLPNETKSHEWSFLSPIRSLTTQAPYATGTITIVAGVVTLSGGTWPSWAASGELVYNGVAATVNTRDSGTQLTLDDTSLAVAAGTSYQLVLAVQSLPDDFGGLAAGGFTWPASTGRDSIPVTSIGLLMQHRQSNGVQVGRPCEAAIVVDAKSTSTGTRWSVAWNPVPDAAYILSYRMNVLMDTLVATTNIYPVGGSTHGETILESCLSIAETYAPDRRSSLHMQMFMQRLAASVALDRQLGAPDTLGYNGDRSDRPNRTHGRLSFLSDSPLTVAYVGPAI
jgi:hypothetical protein